MKELMEGLMTKVGLDRATADKVVAFLKENAGKLPEWIGSNETAKNLASKIPGVGGMFGGGDKS